MILFLPLVLFSLPEAGRAAGELETALSQLAPAPEPAPVEVAPPVISAESIYAFHDHLFSAEAVTFAADRGEIPGQWVENHFAFSGLTPKSDIRLTAPASSGASSVILYNPLAHAVRRITFYDAPAGSQIILYYRVVQEKPSKENNYMTLTVWAGRHQIKRVRLVPSLKKTWQKEVIDLGVSSFFNRAVPLTLDIGTDSSGLLHFTFSGEIKR